jgi:hypothetical protein
MPLMPELAVACREWQGKGAHYNVHQARRCKVHILMCTAGKSRAHYNGTTGAAPAWGVETSRGIRSTLIAILSTGAEILRT